jgi:hypothetical protein
LFPPESFFYPFSLNGFFDDFTDPPSFGPAQRTGFGNDDLVSGLAGIGLVVGSELRLPTDEFFIEPVLYQSLDQDHNGLIHFIADNLTDQLSFQSSVFHGSHYSFIDSVQ